MHLTKFQNQVFVNRPNTHSCLHISGNEKYEELRLGELCAKDKSIKSSEECEAAALALNLTFLGIQNRKGDFPDCYHLTDTIKGPNIKVGWVLFNRASDASTDGRYNVRPICHKGKTGDRHYLDSRNQLVCL